jgi:hypothetical protein
MRQALTTMIVGLSLALSPLAQVSARATDAAGTIARASRLIEAKDYPPATILLEDLLPDADANERRSILELLRQSYEAMAREAKAAGNDREAAHFRDNIAIINRAQGVAPHSAKSSEEKTKKPAASPKPVMNANTTSDATGTTDLLPSAPSHSLPVLAQASPPPSPPELAPVSEPATTPAQEALPVLPKALKLASSLASDAVIRPSSPLLSQNDAAPDAGDAMTRSAQTDAAVTGSKSPSLISAPEKSAGRGESSPKPPKPSLEEGDRWWTAGRYDEAGRCYAALARENRLPARRNVHWAYCRYRAVANRINHQPQTTRDWDEIASEITSIQRLAPNIWYGEYLRKKVAEVRRSGRKPAAKSDNLVVRGSEPDESQKQPDPQSRRFPRLFGKSRAVASARAEAAPVVVASPSASGERPLNLPGDSGDSSQPTIASAADIGTGADPTSTGSGSAAQSRPAQDAAVKRAGADAEGVAWQLYETPNFRVFHQDARLAAAAGNAAESVRAAQAKRWASSAGERPWTPPCDLYLYPSGKIFARETKQPETSPGFSTMMCNGNRVVTRRINLRADHPLLVTAILPHEVTHVVLADLFTDQQIPRWADEGIAVLAEPRAEQAIRAAELQEPLQAGRVFDLRKLMAMEYPDAKDWSLYYAQSVSVTRFLVEQGPPEKFVQFVQNSLRDGTEGALRGTYGIGGFAELQDRWTKYARQRLAPVKEASRDPGSQPAGIEVK